MRRPIAIALACLAVVGLAAYWFTPGTNSIRRRNQLNLKTNGMAVVAYAVQNQSYPRGTLAESSQLPVEERLSWIVSLLPYMEEIALYRQITPDQPWNSPENDPVTSLPITQLRNPGVATFGPANGTHYVGMAGVGADAAGIDDDDPRAGMFGYQRATGQNDVRDGASNTILMMSVNAKVGPWAQGGQSTVRPLAFKPYINGPDGFGSASNGAYVLMVDGAVRFLTPDTDPAVLKALATKAGRESVEVP